MRLAVVLSHPTQYYSPWFRWIRKNTSIQFRVFYMWDFGVTRKVDPHFGTALQWDVDLLSGYDSEFAPNTSVNPGAESFFGFRNPSLGSRLKGYAPDAMLVFGYKWASHLKAIAWARARRIPVLFRGDSNLIGRPSPPLSMSLPLRVLFSQLAGFLYVGTANLEYFEKFGVPRRKLFFSPHSVDDSLYSPSDEQKARSLELRGKLGIPHAAKVFLFAGKLVPGKRPVELVRSFLELGARDAVLVVVGDGAEKPELMRVVAEAAGREGNSPVHFLPFANQSEMPSTYLLADVFVLPSEAETWGLVINEAMHMGIPCLVCDNVGCQRDLVTEGETGWVFKAGEPGSLGAALSRALKAVSSESERARILAAVGKRILAYTYARTTDGLAAALESLES